MSSLSEKKGLNPQDRLRQSLAAVSSRLRQSLAILSESVVAAVIMHTNYNKELLSELGLRIVGLHHEEMFCSQTDSFSNNLMQSFTNPYWSNTWAFVKSNKATSNKSTNILQRYNCHSRISFQ